MDLTEFWRSLWMSQFGTRGTMGLHPFFCTWKTHFSYTILKFIVYIPVYASNNPVTQILAGYVCIGLCLGLLIGFMIYLSGRWVSNMLYLSLWLCSVIWSQVVGTKDSFGFCLFLLRIVLDIHSVLCSHVNFLNFNKCKLKILPVSLDCLVIELALTNL